MMENGRGGKLGDPRQIPILHELGGVQAAAGKQGILDTGGEHIPKAHFQVEVVQFLQKAVLHIVGEVGQTVPVDFIHGPLRRFHQLCADVPILYRAVFPFQRFRHGGVVVLPHCPQIGRFRPLHRAGVRYVKDIFQRRPAPSVFMDQSNALGTRLHPSPHGFIPQLHAGTGSGVRALGVDQKLVIERISVESGGGIQVPLPGGCTACHIIGGLICQFRYSL